MSFLRGLALGAVLLSASSTALAGVIYGGGNLDNTGADQLETWLGSGDLDFTNVFSGVRGDSVSAFHAAVDGVGPTFSIYEIVFITGETALIGGYTQNDWGANTGFTADSTAFIFNLTTLEAQFTQHYSDATYLSDGFFPAFGGGHDIFGGYSYLGVGNTYAFSHTYDWSQGSIAFAGDSGYGWAGGAGCDFNCFDVLALDVYTFVNASSVPEPSSIALMGLGLVGLGFARRKKAA